MRRGSALLATLLLGGVAQAQDGGMVDQITVIAPARFGAHADALAPVLVYRAADLQVFEPTSVGAMLKGLPGVAFRSEAGQYESPQLLGIGPEYTQVLIDGQRVPGAEENRGVLLDRIPPEMVQRVEILRSPTAELDAQGVGGTVNLILKEPADLRGLHLRGDVTHGEEGPTRGGGYIGYGGGGGALSWLLGADLRHRHDARAKNLVLYDASGGLIEKSGGWERRDGRDSSFNARLAWQLDSATLDFGAFRYGTRYESEFPQRSPGTALLRLERDEADERTDGIELRGRGGEAAGWSAALGHGRNHTDRHERTDETTEEGLVTDEDIGLRVRDRESRLHLEKRFAALDAGQLRIGVQGLRKHRASVQRVRQDEEGAPLEADAAEARYRVEEHRADSYVQGRWRLAAPLWLDTGLRLEWTGLAHSGRDIEGAQHTAQDSRTDLLPNLHLMWDAGPDDRLRLSLAQTQRRPDFNQLLPFAVRDESRLLLGNPGLRPERAYGADLAYERRVRAGAATFCANLFFRRIKHLIELRRIAEDTVSPVNGATGGVWGLVLDGRWSLPLHSPSGLEFEASVGWFDSRVRDAVTGEFRRFQQQPTYVLNLGLQHELSAQRLRWGTNLMLSGESREYLADQITHSDYGAVLEAFVEYAASPTLILRLTGSDLLESRLTETQRSFDGDRPLAPLDEIEIEHETQGPRAMLTLRMRF